MAKSIGETERREVIARSKDYLQPDKSGRGWICPICGSGSGNKGTGITTKDGIHFSCWAGCFSNADIIDIIGLERGLDGYKEKLEAACEALGIASPSGARAQKQTGKTTVTQQKLHNHNYTTKPTQPEPDYTAFYKEAASHIGETSYHRGLGKDTLEKFWIGYAPAWTHPKRPQDSPTPRLIIPTSSSSYLARRTDGGEDNSKMKVGSTHIFNSKAIWEASRPLYIVEGEIDALSVIEAGGEAIGLGSSSNVKALLRLLEDKRPSSPYLLLCLDKDKGKDGKEGAGEKAQKELVAGLERLEIPFYEWDISCGYNDPNEALEKARETFTQAVWNGENMEYALRAAEWEKLEAESGLGSLPSFLQAIEERSGRCIPTGFGNVDALLDGGLYSGLYCIGAVSSLGKTTFVLQMADQIAAQGRDVLFFSLEMSRHEMMAKSISRLTYEESLRQTGETKLAKSTIAILTGKRYYSDEERDREVMESALERYKVFSGNVFISEGMGDIGVKEIRKKIEQFKLASGGRVPSVIFVDYLQILAPADPRATDKQNTDKAVLELKRISRDYGIAVVAISSFNRESYTAPVNLTSFKESGAIEYSSDVLIGLQYEGMDYKEGESEKKRDERVRVLRGEVESKSFRGEAVDVQLRVLKNRNGKRGNTGLTLLSIFNHYSMPDNYYVPNLEENGQAKAGETSLRKHGGESEEWTKVDSTSGNKSHKWTGE